MSLSSCRLRPSVLCHRPLPVPPSPPPYIYTLLFRKTPLCLSPGQGESLTCCSEPQAGKKQGRGPLKMTRDFEELLTPAFWKDLNDKMKRRNETCPSVSDTPRAGRSSQWRFRQASNLQCPLFCFNCRVCPARQRPGQGLAGAPGRGDGKAYAGPTGGTEELPGCGAADRPPRGVPPGDLLPTHAQVHRHSRGKAVGGSEERASYRWCRARAQPAMEVTRQCPQRGQACPRCEAGNYRQGWGPSLGQAASQRRTLHMGQSRKDQRGGKAGQCSWP